jgi:hypothetical protein
LLVVVVVVVLTKQQPHHTGMVRSVQAGDIHDKYANIS